MHIVAYLALISMLSFSVRSFLIPKRLGLLRCRRLSSANTPSLKNFITNIIESDISSNKNGGRVVTRFPPEPNGYLHLGHAKSVNFNFGVAKQYNGVTHMRFDDTNPAKEDMEYITCILNDVRWLMTGQCNPPEDKVPWHGSVRHASDYFPEIYLAAEYLINEGLAYVDDLSIDEIREYRGSRNEPGMNSPFRNRSIEENLILFRKMRSAEFREGACVLRAKIDMTSPNMNMRDPLLYRIKSESHPMTGDKWCIYPMYDFAHAISDALEGITHSLCTLEFEAHRPLYDWVVDSLLPSGILPFKKEGWRPQQIEFSRLNVQHTVLSKRKLIQLVQDKHVEGWDDPRMPTICGMRRRGYPHTALKLFCDRVGVTKTDSNFDMTALEECVREVLEHESPRLFAVLSPLKVTITNWDGDSETELLSVDRHPKRPELGKREVPFSASVFIERDDFFDTGPNGEKKPPAGYKRLLPGGQVRLRFACVITCNEVVRNVEGEVVELRCTYVPENKKSSVDSSEASAATMKVKGVIPWVSQSHAVSVAALLYDRLFVTPIPGKDHPTGDFVSELNPKSLETVNSAVIEPSVLKDVRHGSTYQFERLGYFTVDTSSTSESLRFNRVVTLKDTWAERATAVTASESAEKIKHNTQMEEFYKVDLRVGQILAVEKHPSADSLYVTKVQCDESPSAAPRTVVCGLVKHLSPDQLLNQKVIVACNLKPAKLRGVLSEGMILAASGSVQGVEKVELLLAPSGALVGSSIFIPGCSPSGNSNYSSRANTEMWKRVSGHLRTTDSNQVLFGVGGEGSTGASVLMTSAGACTVTTLTNATVS